MAIDLEKSRAKIDEIDAKIMELFEMRMNTVLDVAEYKKENGLDIFHPGREKTVIEKNVNRIKDENLKKYAEKFLISLMDISKEYQKDRIGEL